MGKKDEVPAACPLARLFGMVDGRIVSALFQSDMLDLLQPARLGLVLKLSLSGTFRIRILPLWFKCLGCCWNWWYVNR